MGRGIGSRKILAKGLQPKKIERFEFVLTTALILTFSPKEKEQQSSVFGLLFACPANTVA
jgi:hypothetical protein